jgi:hypothetical protein
MSALSILAVILAVVAAVTTGLRAQMLKPDFSPWPDAPRCVRWASFGLSLVLATYAWAVIQGYRATTGEVAILAALAGYSALLWANLLRQVRAAD